MFRPRFPGVSFRVFPPGLTPVLSPWPTPRGDPSSVQSPISSYHLPRRPLGHTSANAKRSQRPVTWIAAASLCSLAACFSPAELRDRADADAYALIDERRQRLFQDDGPFALPANTEAFGRESGAELELLTTRDQVVAGGLRSIGPLDVITALTVASENSEEVQRQKESLYVSALNLAEEEWRFGYRYNADGNASVSGDAGGDFVQARTGFGASMTRVLGSGATILGSIGSDLFRFVSTGDGWDAVTDLGLSITQPLLRGSGQFITLEPLRQTERNLVYAVRAYERFRRTYAVNVSERVYRVQQSLDQLKNETLNFESLLRLSTRNKRLAEAGQLSEIQVDQARQDELRSRNRLVTLQGNVERQLDNFKVFLGLPVGVEVSFEEGILRSLGGDSSFLEGLDEDKVVEFAIKHRLDIMTVFDQVQDATRREAILRDSLRAGLGISGSADSSSDEGNPLGHSMDDVQFRAAVDLDLPVDLLPARNAWRRAELTLVDQRRGYERFLDEVTVSVRDALRRARNDYTSLEIQIGAVALSERRVLGAELSLQAGTASTRDLLESQDALRQVRDAETSARIDFTLSLLDLWLELEILRVDEGGVRLDPELSAELRAL